MSDRPYHQSWAESYSLVKLQSLFNFSTFFYKNTSEKNAFQTTTFILYWIYFWISERVPLVLDYGTEIRHSSSGLALGNNWLKFSAAQYGSEMLTSKCLQKWHALELFLTVKSSLRHIREDLLAGVSTICDSCGRFAVRWPLTLQKYW